MPFRRAIRGVLPSDIGFSDGGACFQMVQRAGLPRRITCLPCLIHGFSGHRVTLSDLCGTLFEKAAPHWLFLFFSSTPMMQVTFFAVNPNRS